MNFGHGILSLVTSARNTGTKIELCPLRCFSCQEVAKVAPGFFCQFCHAFLGNFFGLFVYFMCVACACISLLGRIQTILGGALRFDSKNELKP